MQTLTETVESGKALFKLGNQSLKERRGMLFLGIRVEDNPEVHPE